ncbi:uncharacterized protein SAPINGB_P005674 [Magnusiomyces paraingens]|uniref:Transcription initiation factor TFIID subunit 9 n=1 Tax=Magnusiomyces paraingens TaxID=2606893 RepID=A0A5E8C388_9ASCO|nr:uncharacterized protein SAPINGB_P005674 [Saprochaete ingens]VVT57395.1 unnamed protein product [Saprochaete ingens]
MEESKKQIIGHLEELANKSKDISNGNVLVDSKIKSQEVNGVLTDNRENGIRQRNEQNINSGDPLKSSKEDLPSVIPRDVRLLHLILASMGVTSYEDRVPLQLMDFAYRFTHGILQDALIYNDHAHSSITPAGLGPAQKPLTTEDVRLAIAARLNYQFKPAPPKEMLLELAQEKNRRPLPIIHEQWGLRLPPEKFCLTAKEWSFEEEKESLQKKKRIKTNDDIVVSGRGV